MYLLEVPKGKSKRRERGSKHSLGVPEGEMIGPLTLPPLKVRRPWHTGKSLKLPEGQ